MPPTPYHDGRASRAYIDNNDGSYNRAWIIPADCELWGNDHERVPTLLLRAPDGRWVFESHYDNAIFRPDPYVWRLASRGEAACFLLRIGVDLPEELERALAPVPPDVARNLATLDEAAAERVTPDSAACAEPPDTPESAPCAEPLETPADLIRWIKGRRAAVRGGIAAGQMFGRSDVCTPIARRAHYLASDLADRLGLRGLPPRPTGPLDVEQVASVLADLLTWARDAALAPAAPAAPPAGHAQGNAPAAAVPAKGMTWQDAARAAEDHCRRNPFPGVNALAKIVRETTGRSCAESTMSKAIDRSPELRAKRVEHEAAHRSVSTVAMTKGAAASARQTREPDPIDAASASTDDRYRRLLEQATQPERAKMNAMTPDEQRELVAMVEHDPQRHGPDESPRVRGRSR